MGIRGKVIWKQQVPKVLLYADCRTIETSIARITETIHVLKFFGFSGCFAFRFLQTDMPTDDENELLAGRQAGRLTSGRHLCAAHSPVTASHRSLCRVISSLLRAPHIPLQITGRVFLTQNALRSRTEFGKCSAYSISIWKKHLFCMLPPIPSPPCGMPSCLVVLMQQSTLPMEDSKYILSSEALDVGKCFSSQRSPRAKLTQT